MRRPTLTDIFRKKPQTLPAVLAPDELVSRIMLRISAPPPSFSPEENALGASSLASLSRAALALNLLRLRAARDIAAVPVLNGFLRRAFSTEDYWRVAAAFDKGLREKSQAIAQSGSPDLKRRVDEALNANFLFREIEGALDQALGAIETPTDETFDEAGYLAANPDVAAAVAQGGAASGRKHWRAHGQAEGRLQRRYGKRNAASLVYPLRFVRDPNSNAPVGELEPAERIATPQKAPYVLLPLSQAEEHDATPSFSLETSLGRDSPDFSRLLGQCAWAAPPLYIAAFEDACVDVVNGLVTFDGGKVWGDSAFATILSPGAEGRAPDIFRLGDRYAWRRDSSLLEEAPPGAALMLCTSWASRANYGHWLMNSLFSVYLVLDSVRDGRLKLLCPPLDDRQKRDLATLGAPPEAIVETKARYVRGKRLLYPSPLCTFANTKPPARAAEFLDFVKRRFAPRMISGGPEYVFLSRQGFPSARRMTNETALAEALRRAGFHVARPHEMPLGEQIALMSNAKVAIGQFGAALWNTPFMPEGANVVEIATSNYVSNEYLYISHLTGHRLHRVMIDASATPGRAYHGDHFEFEAPVESIVALARSLM
ncbi:glycosyltransferase family 61 protein [Methylocystis parvus]|uniref:Glycosyltransferase family 61 protein n=1 Tax=Methylocystis parvus TaxID=134 RepID=A0A6B8M953_9HYPH|nr:glycosyltransferase 61 family protein [Methylocystis parvus]QGM99118.1 glycosyltransferase family 61 protein [Methylocystis parvus]WBK00510.1 glycosyltransferase family 61 protein [Methylocystis parvus OBBP]